MQVLFSYKMISERLSMSCKCVTKAQESSTTTDVVNCFVTTYKAKGLTMIEGNH